jgi:hypothetical protein
MYYRIRIEHISNRLATAVAHRLSNDERSDERSADRSKGEEDVAVVVMIAQHTYDVFRKNETEETRQDCVRRRYEQRYSFIRQSLIHSISRSSGQSRSGGWRLVGRRRRRRAGVNRRMITKRR